MNKGNLNKLEDKGDIRRVQEEGNQNFFNNIFFFQKKNFRAFRIDNATLTTALKRDFLLGIHKLHYLLILQNPTEDSSPKIQQSEAVLT